MYIYIYTSGVRKDETLSHITTLPDYHITATTTITTTTTIKRSPNRKSVSSIDSSL